jgi:hypothetical protein
MRKFAAINESSKRYLRRITGKYVITRIFPEILPEVKP